MLSKTDLQLEQLEKLTDSVEFALVQKDVLFGLKRGTEVLKMINEEMGGLEGVEKLMGETEEARRYQQVRQKYPTAPVKGELLPPSYAEACGFDMDPDRSYGPREHTK